MQISAINLDTKKTGKTQKLSDWPEAAQVFFWARNLTSGRLPNKMQRAKRRDFWTGQDFFRWGSALGWAQIGGQAGGERSGQEDRLGERGLDRRTGWGRGAWTGGQVEQRSEQRTSRGEVYSKQEDRTKSKGEGWTGGQIGGEV